MPAYRLLLLLIVSGWLLIVVTLSTVAHRDIKINVMTDGDISGLVTLRKLVS